MMLQEYCRTVLHNMGNSSSGALTQKEVDELVQVPAANIPPLCPSTYA